MVLPFAVSLGDLCLRFHDVQSLNFKCYEPLAVVFCFRRVVCQTKTSAHLNWANAELTACL